MRKLIAFCLVVFLIIYGITNIDDIKQMGNKEKRLVLYDSVVRKENSLYGMQKDKLIRFEDGKLAVMDMKEEEKEEKSLVLDVENPIMDISEDYIYIGDREKGEIYQINKDMEVHERIPLNKELLNLKVSNDNLIYHLKDREDDMEVVGIINKDGQQVSRYNFLGNVLSYCSGSGENTLAVGILEEKLGKFCSTLKVYDEFEEIQSLNFDGKIIMDIKFLNKREILVMTEDAIYSVSKKDIKWEKELKFLRDLKINEKDIYALNGSKVEVINSRGEVIRELELEKEYDKIEIYQPRKSEVNLILYGDHGLDIYNSSGIETSWQGEITTLRSSGEDIFILDEDKCGSYKVIYEEVD